jgi:hypothetical protein
MVHPITHVLRGIHDYDLDPETSVRLSSFLADAYSQQASPALRLIREIQSVLPLSKGVWLIATADEERLIAEDITQKVRDITLVVVHEEEANHEI